MSKKMRMPLLALMTAALAAAVLLAGFRLTEKAVPKIGLYSWGDSVFDEEEWETLRNTLHTLKITELYQEVTAPQAPETQALLQRLSAKKIDVYYLTGRAEWGLAGGEQDVMREIDTVAQYNRTHDAGFSGILLDIEPYATDAWDEDRQQVMNDYVAVMKAAYAHARAADVRVLLCIPGWYDRSHGAALEALIRDCCDEVSVMNYNRADELGSIRAEVLLAQKYKKEIACIFEFQEIGYHSLTENETYGSAGLKEGKAAFDAVYRTLGYDGLKFAYHYYDAIKQQ